MLVIIFPHSLSLFICLFIFTSISARALQCKQVFTSLVLSCLDCFDCLDCRPSLSISASSFSFSSSSSYSCRCLGAAFARHACKTTTAGMSGPARAAVGVCWRACRRCSSSPAGGARTTSSTGRASCSRHWRSCEEEGTRQRGGGRDDTREVLALVVGVVVGVVVVEEEKQKEEV